MKKIILLLVLFIFSEKSYSQEGRLQGYVKDSVTHEPLAKASIVVDYRKLLTSTVTDSSGKFSISLPIGNHVVVVRYLGYVPIRILVYVGSNGANIQFGLQTTSSQLEEVVVTQKGFDRTVRQPILGVSQINIKTLRKLPSAFGEVDILRGLQMLPGVTSVGEAANGVNIRGGSTDQNLILLDDTPIFNPTHMFGLFAVVSPDAISGLDLYKGNVPARYGGRAVSVLDIATRNPDLEQFKLSGGVSFVASRLVADIPVVKNKLGILFSGRGAFNDFLLPLVTDRLSGIKAQFGDFTAKIFWRLNDKNTISAMGYYSKDFFQTSLLANLPNVSGTSTQYYHETSNAMIRWLKVINSRLDLQTTFIYAHYSPTIASPELNADNVVKLRSDLYQQQVKSSLNYQLENSKTEFGISGIDYRIEPGTLLPGNSTSINYITTPTEKAWELAAFLDEELNLSKKLVVSAGLRYSAFLNRGPGLVRNYTAGEERDEFSVIDSVRYGSGDIIKFYGGFEPRLGIRYSINEISSIKLGYNLMRQYLQVVTNTATPLPTSRWKTSDQFIKPQISNLVSLGYYRSLRNNIYELSLEGYYRTTDHIIDYKPGADFLLQAYPETQLLQGKNLSYGIEAMISKKKGELTGWVNYTFSRSMNQVNEGRSITQQINGGQWYRANYDRPHSLNASMNIEVDKHNSFGFTFVYSTGRPFSVPEGFVESEGSIYPYYNNRNNERMPDYHRLDFSWNIYNPTLKNKRWQGHWAFTVYNIYARKNDYSVFFRTENGKTKAYALQIFAAPIISLSYNFVFR